MTGDDAVERARACFLDDRRDLGCAETCLVVLRSAFELDGAADPSAAMALNGGIAYSGGMCGAISGAGIALGELAARRLPDRAVAKRVARGIVQHLIDGFEREFGAVDCRDLIGMELRAPGAHDAFLASGIWRDRCMHQVEFVVREMAALSDEAAWNQVLREIG
jgi:C_GCAxxG_C_C family probable redox protein